MTDITSTDNPATAQLNRRAALLGAAATSVAMVTPTVAAPFPLKPVDPVRAPGPLGAEVAMMDAARQFVHGGDKTIHWNAGFVLSEAE